MSSQLITNIRQLCGVQTTNKLLRGKELSFLPVIEDAFLLVEDNRIAAYGPMNTLNSSTTQTVDVAGAFVLPAWCDSHTHLVFPASREMEFVQKIKGATYAEIAAAGGGILNSAKKLKETSEDQLFTLAWQRLEEVSRLGTAAIEIKSGYGLSTESELKMLRVIKKLKERSKLTIKSTFLGAHTFPLEYRDDHAAYISLIINEMLPVIAQENLADYIDVFCEQGFFSPAEMESIVRAGQQYGLKPKLHVNQLHSIGGIASAVKLGALSVDHLEVMTEEDVSTLAGSDTIATLLPTAAFFLRMDMQPARQIIDAGCAVALASDFNPGSSPSGNMNFVASLGCIQMKMLPEEVINAGTINGAYAMETQNETGSITIGKKANLIITKQIPSLAYLPYAFGSNHIEKVMIEGQWV